MWCAARCINTAFQVQDTHVDVTNVTGKARAQLFPCWRHLCRCLCRRKKITSDRNSCGAVSNFILPKKHSCSSDFPSAKRTHAYGGNDQVAESENDRYERRQRTELVAQPAENNKKGRC